MISKFVKKVKGLISSRVRGRKLYDTEMVKTLDDRQIISLRSKYLRHLSFFSVLLLFSLFGLIGVYLIGSPKGDFSDGLRTYRREQDFLAEKLDAIYGRGNWQYGVYQTNMDAYRVEVTLSNGSRVEHFYQIRGGNVYKLDLEQ